MRTLTAAILAACLSTGTTGALRAEERAPLRVLFLGDKGHHRPAERARQLIPLLALRGLDITYTEQLADLDPAVLSNYDGLIVYANIGSITADAEKALLDYVAGGKGFIPIHCASYCFLNSRKYVDLVGAQFQRHGMERFATRVLEPDHPVMRNVREFVTYDETYVHTKHNEKDRTVLQVRREGDRDEPWTWVRTHGKGRVFYTAYGHDHRTWGHPGFHALLERGIRWACGDDRVIANNPLARLSKLKPFQYKEAKLPNYLRGKNWGTQGSPLNRMQLPVGATESMKHMIVPEGFEVRLFAADPDIQKPICMNWDERGRLWIAETKDYPNEIKREGSGLDRIRILEDTDGDGRADRFTLFADKLSIPTSILPYKDGAIVQQAPHTLFLRDTDGDGVCDERRVLFSGWSTGDTHAGPSNLHWGFDNRVWGIVGYSGFNGEVGGEKHRFSTGFYRFEPDGSGIEFLRNTNNNSWGVSFSEDGVLFGSTANGCPSVYMPIPNRYYEQVRGWSSRRLERTSIGAKFHPITELVRQVDHHGNFTAAAGHALYTARSFPEHYWNRTAFVNGPTGHLCATFLIEKVGADFVTRNSWNLLASDDEWTAPIMAEVGPDGAVWMIDWYNYIVQHNPTPRGFKTGRGNAYETPLRDKVHGRIYRVVWKKGKSTSPRTLADASPAKLVATLRDPNLFWRKTAQRLLVQRGERDIVPDLLEILAERAVDGIGNAPASIHALWTLKGLGALDGDDDRVDDAALGCLTHPAAGARRAALDTVPRRTGSIDAIVRTGVLVDPDGQVRLAAFLALAEMPASARAARAIVAAIAHPANADDRWIPDAMTSAAARHDESFLVSLTALRGKPAGDTTLRTIAARVAEHHARGESSEMSAGIVASLAKAERPVADAIVTGLEKGWDGKKILIGAKDLSRSIVSVLAKLSPENKGKLVSLANRWRVEGLEKFTEQIAEGFLQVASDGNRADADRSGAARQLVEFLRRDDAAVEDVIALIAPTISLELSKGLLEAVSVSRSARVGTAIVEALGGMTPAVKREAQLVLLKQRDWTRALVRGAANSEVDISLFTLDQKQMIARHPDKDIRESARAVLEKSGGLPDPDRQKVIDELLAAMDKKSGDVKKGKEAFTKVCAKCHTHSGEGTKIGPDLTGMAAHPASELAVHVLDPSRSVEGNYRQYTVVTTKGRTLTGMLASETRTSIEIFDAEGKKTVVLREDIARLDGSRLSLMPAGFEKQIGTDGLVDLLAFLTKRGKYLPLRLDKTATIVTTKGMFYTEASRHERIIFDDWKPKTVEGVPFHLVDPQGDRVPNGIMLHSPNGAVSMRMPKRVVLSCNSAAKAIHLLSGVSGWGSQGGDRKTVSMVVRLHYADGQREEHKLIDGVHFADYIRRIDVPGSKLAFILKGRQLRYLAVYPKRAEKIREIELLKGRDRTAPIVMSVTVESAE